MPGDFRLLPALQPAQNDNPLLSLAQACQSRVEVAEEFFIPDLCFWRGCYGWNII